MSPLQFYQQLLQHLECAPLWCIATIIETRGSAPRKVATQMAIGIDATAPRKCIGSIGGGLAEAKVIETARSLTSMRRTEIKINLAGELDQADPDHSGICGGWMRAELQAFTQKDLTQQTLDIVSVLIKGGVATWSSAALGAVCLQPMPMCLIGGGGHCGLALEALLSDLGFITLVIDDREQILGCDMDQLGPAKRCHDWQEALTRLSQYGAGAKAPMVCLLSRSYAQDLLALRALADSQLQFAYIGMMGSARRIRLVLSAAPELPDRLTRVLKAPIGLAIGAETPLEIATSIAAELVQMRQASD